MAHRNLLEAEQTHREDHPEHLDWDSVQGQGGLQEAGIGSLVGSRRAVGMVRHLVELEAFHLVRLEEEKGRVAFRDHQVLQV